MPWVSLLCLFSGIGFKLFPDASRKRYAPCFLAGRGSWHSLPCYHVVS
jgi:hypothetical protein